MSLTPIDIPPGVVRNGTQYEVGEAGRWYDANLVRWVSGVLSPVGGWDRRDTQRAAGFLRDLLAWRDNSVGRYLAVGSNEGLYVATGASDLTDITPAGFVAGRENDIFGFGYGYGSYGASSYGTARVDSSGNFIGAAGWSLDTWGEHLVACAPHDGRLVEWDLTAGTRPTTANDETTNNNAGTLVGGPTWTADEVNTEIRGALSFDGVDDKVEVGDVAALNFGTGDFTLEAWIKAPATAAVLPIFWKGTASGGLAGYELFLTATGTLRGAVSDGTNTVDVVSVADFDDDLDHHVQLVREGTTIKVRVDEADVVTGSNASLGSTDNADIFTLGNRGTEFYKGLITDARAWNVARTLTQTADNNDIRLKGSETNLVGYWRLDDGIFLQSPASVILNAPTSCRGVLVTPERHTFALGAGSNPRKIAWSDREDNTVWAAAATNTAGALELQTSGEIRVGVKVRGQTLVLTSYDVHLVTFVGSPFVYGKERISGTGGTDSPRSAVAFQGMVAWMANDGFYVFDGLVRKIPCAVEDFVLQGLNTQQASKVIGGHNRGFSEIWWFYPSGSSFEPNRYVVWNYRDDHWTIGSLTRTGFASPGVYRNPIMAGTDAFLYEHEVGYKDDGASILSSRYAESGAIDLGNGDRVLRAKSLLPDEKTVGQTKMSFKTRFEPNGVETTHGPYDLSKRTDVRFTGRQVAVRVEGAADDAWRVGIPRLEVEEGGKR